jgi:crossover junction endodeoxyribonuclease RusA
MRKVVLPYPPSANKLWKPIGPGRLIKTPEYRAWMAEASWVADMAARDQGQVRGAYKLTILACPPSLNRRRDVGNLEKSTSDALVKGGLVEDDSLCQEITIRWASLDDPGLLVQVKPTEVIQCTPLNTSAKSGLSSRPSKKEPPSAGTGQTSGLSLTAAEFRKMWRTGFLSIQASKKLTKALTRTRRRRGDT